MNNKKKSQMALPALRGVMGDWVFYSCLMNMREIADRVSYANEIHSNKNLSDMIQRQLTRGRSDQIAHYLENQNERFFNSLVVATYGGQPNWHALSGIRNKTGKEELKDLTEETIESLGFLTLRGDENLFALDGQHRLSGVKKFVKKCENRDFFDEVSVIFVSHKKTPKGLERTRRLFTTLNKTARPVSKGDIIALDEDDVMALSVRWLIEQTKLFSGDRIAFVSSNNMPTNNHKSITTIGNLYDVISILFTATDHDLTKKKPELQRVRPSDDELKRYYELVESYFRLLAAHFKEVSEFFSAKHTESVVNKYRGSHGGNALFRPIGLEIFAKVIARLSKDVSLKDAVMRAAKLPRDLSKPPFDGLMWNSKTSTISNAHKVTLREVLLYMLGCSRYSDVTLRARYRKELGDDAAELPAKVV
jgi:DNA sulfur modification protein DndB